MGRPKKSDSPSMSEIPSAGADQEEENNHVVNDFAPSTAKPRTSQADMIRASFAAAIQKPEDGVVWIKEHYGETVARNVWSQYKSKEKKKLEGGGGTKQPRLPAQSQLPQQQVGVPVGFSGDVKHLRLMIQQCGGSAQLKGLISELGGLLSKYGTVGLLDIVDALED